MQTIDTLTQDQRRIKNQLAVLDRLTDLRRRADELRSLLGSIAADQRRAACSPKSTGRAAFMTDSSSLRMGESYIVRENIMCLSFATIGRMLNVIVQDAQAELAAVCNEVDVILNEHCEVAA